MNFREDVVPKLSALQSGLRERPIHIEVRRLSPLSLTIEVEEPLDVADTVVEALELLARPEREAVAS